MADIIDLGNIRFQLKRKYRLSAQGDCDHKHIELDDRGGIVRCLKCGLQLSAFWALEMLAEQYGIEMEKLRCGRKALAEAKNAELHLLAARKVEKAWRGRKMVPACPHCGRGILPEDGWGDALVNREIELRRRAVSKAEKNQK
jgi:hypothetical protein